MHYRGAVLEPNKMEMNACQNACEFQSPEDPCGKAAEFSSSHNESEEQSTVAATEKGEDAFPSGDSQMTAEQEMMVRQEQSSGSTGGFKFFVGGIHPDALDDDVSKYFSQYGVVKEIRVLRDHCSGRNRGFGFVTLEDDSGRDALFKSEHRIRNKRIEVREMQPDGTSNLKRKVFIGGINPQLAEAQLEEHFKQFGTIEKVTIMRDLDGKSRGFGFVVYEDESSVSTVLATKVHDLDDENKVEVRAAEARHRAPIMKGRGVFGAPMTNYGYANNTMAYANCYNQWYGRGGYAGYGGYAMTAGQPGATYSPGYYGMMGYGGVYDSYGPQRAAGISQGRGRGGYRAGPY